MVHCSYWYNECMAYLSAVTTLEHWCHTAQHVITLPSTEPIQRLCVQKQKHITCFLTTPQSGPGKEWLRRGVTPPQKMTMQHFSCSHPTQTPTTVQAGDIIKKMNISLHAPIMLFITPACDNGPYFSTHHAGCVSCHSGVPVAYSPGKREVWYSIPTCGSCFFYLQPYGFMYGL